MDTLRLLTRGTHLKTRAAPITSDIVLAPATISNGLTGKKRKRDASSPGQADLPQEEIRQIQQSRKIRIIDLRTLHQDQDLDKSRKSRKEQSRVYPQPLTAFSRLKSNYNASARLVDNIGAQGYTDPTDVQLATIPVLLRGKDEPHLLTVAPTGSGKTLAFLVQAVNKVLSTRQKADSIRQTSVIILAPTKELMEQILNEGRKLVEGLGIAISAMRKGMKIHHDTSSSNDDASTDHGTIRSDIVIATPLTLVHTLSGSGENQIHSLPSIHTLILDEADVLLDPLFREQTLSIWSACTSSSLRISFWSATIGASIESLVLSKLPFATPLLRVIVGLKDTSLPHISHHLIHSGTEHGKLVGFRQLLHPAPAASTTPSTLTTTSSLTTLPTRIPLPWLIFTQTIARAQALFSELQYDIPPHSQTGLSRIAVLHSSLSDTERSSIMTRFRRAEIWLLITTDLLSRGIDFAGVRGVINYDIPTTSASYVHRAGRTGRTGREGRRDGVCVTFYTKDDVRYLKGCVNVIERSAVSEASKASGESMSSTESKASTTNGVGRLDIPQFLRDLPDVSKKDRRELKQRGVDVRRAIREGVDEEGVLRNKRKARIGTVAGWERRRENNLVGAKEAARKRRVGIEDDGSDGVDGVSEGGGVDGWTGFGD